jgi:hypothetical protein
MLRLDPGAFLGQLGDADKRHGATVHTSTYRRHLFDERPGCGIMET